MRFFFKSTKSIEGQAGKQARRVDGLGGSGQYRLAGSKG